MAGRLVQVERLDPLDDRADEALADRELGDVDRFLLQPAGGEQLEAAVAQQVDRADLARHRLADDVDDAVELGLRAGARRHHVVKAGQDLARGGSGGGGRGHADRATRMARGFPIRKPPAQTGGDPHGGPESRPSGGVTLFVTIRESRGTEACAFCEGAFAPRDDAARRPVLGRSLRQPARPVRPQPVERAKIGGTVRIAPESRRRTAVRTRTRA